MIVFLNKIELFGMIRNKRKEFGLISSDSALDSQCINIKSLKQIVSRDLPPEEKKDILKLHNSYRRSLKAADMFQLTWSHELAENSRFFAKQCLYKNSVKALAKKMIDFNYGESIAAIPIDSERIDWESVIHKWFTSQKFLDKIKGSCSGDCKPYRNIIFAPTQEIGPVL